MEPRAETTVQPSAHHLIAISDDLLLAMPTDHTREFRDFTAAERERWFVRMTGWSYSFRIDEIITAYTDRTE